MIKVSRLTKYYGPTRAVEDVTFEAEKGEIVGLLGPNGAGKTTIMRMLTGYFAPTSGTAKIAGFDIIEEPMEVKKRLGYLPEVLPLYYEMVVSDYLEFVSQIKGITFKERRAKVAKALGLARIEDVKHRIIGRLSRGYKQRVGIAQALLNDPEVLILDEPTIGLDPKQIIEIRELIKSLGGSRTVLLSSHILPEVSMTCEKIIIINKGRVAAVTDKAAIEGKDRIIVKLLGEPAKAAAALSKVKSVANIEQSLEGPFTVLTLESSGKEDIRQDVFKAVVESGLILVEMRQASHTLEEVFLKYTAKEEDAR